jgi:hypothetical protein
VQLSEEGIRKLADERMKEWSKDQEEYTERQFREIEGKKAALKSLAGTSIERVEVEKKAALKSRYEKLGMSAKALEEEEMMRKTEELRARYDAEQKRILKAREPKEAMEKERIKRNSVVYARREKEAEAAEDALNEEFSALLSPVMKRIQVLRERQAKINKLGKKAAGETKESEAAIATEKRELKQRRDAINDRREEERESRKWYREQKWKEEDAEGTGLITFAQMWGEDGFR